MKKVKHLYLRALFLIMSKNTKLIIYSIGLTVFSTILPYANIIFSSALIDQLVTRNLTMLLNYVCLLVLSDFLLTVITSFFQKKLSRESEQFLTFQTSILSERAACIPYEKFCSKEYQNQRRTLEELSEETEVSLVTVVDITKRIVAAVLSMGMAGITIICGLVDVFGGNKWNYSKIFLTGLLILNVILVIISVGSSWRIYKCRNRTDAEILPSYKINWYLDREYLRFKKTAKEIRIFNQEKIILGLFADANSNIFRIRKRYDKTVFKEKLIADCTKQLSNFTSIITYGVMAIFGAITIGGFNRLGQLTREMYDNVIGFSVILIDCKRINKWLSAFWDYYDFEQYHVDLSLNQHDKNSKKVIVLDNIEFQYSEPGDFSIDKLNLVINRGEHIAIVGKNGSGKSTLVMLMCGLITPHAGKVIALGRASSSLFSTVFQDFSLFSLPMNENISSSCSPDRNKIRTAMEMAGISEGFIDKQDEYLYKQLDPDGIEISGGEKQKIAIARAFYKDSEIIIMDEPTSSLDPISEAVIYEKMHSSLKDKTVIFISHRLSSCKFCDRVIVMDQGNIVQEGSHNTLMEDENGLYYKLWNAQAQYYQI